MKHLYAPWRSDYTSKTARAKNPNTSEDECIFCIISQSKKDEEHFVLHRGKHTFTMLNRFPYNAGHLMVIPYSHTADLESLPQEARIEIIEMLTKASTVLKKSLNAEGINFGINEGKAAGAGIPSHLHVHALPRWLGDTNFLPLLAETKPVSFDLKKIYKQLKKGY